MHKLQSWISRYRDEYPSQFWLIFVGMLISTIGSSMIWPFLMLYVSKKLDLPLAQIASLLTLNAISGLVFSFLAGPIIDRLGRKWVMVASLLGNGIMYLYMSQAGTFVEFAIAQILMGAFNPLYRVGVDAMMADLVPSEKRPAAYSIMRMSNNAGVSIGPAIGGIIASTSYSLAFYIAAGGLVLFGLLIAFRARETLPATEVARPKWTLFEGYGRVFRDHEFLGFTGAFSLLWMLAALVWILLPVYANTNFHIPERQYGFIPTTNALMVVIFQFAVTQVTRRFRSLPVMLAGTLFYVIATVMVAFFTGFWGFWLCMVVMTIGELIISPTATTYIADMAPVDMRGRYMSIFGLTWSVALGIAPVLGGFINDTISPRAVWYGGGVIGVLSVAAFLVLIKKYSHREMERATQ